MSGFINTVDTLGDNAVCDGIIMKTLNEYSDNRIESIGNYALYNCTPLTSVNLPKATSIGSFAFYGCAVLKTANLPVAQSINDYGFYGDRALETVFIPLVTELGKSSFHSCNALSHIDLPSVVSIGDKAFYNCPKLTAIVLRSNTMCELNTTAVFTTTPIASGTGYIYVPSILVETYKLATNWSVYSNQIRAIEDYPDITGG